MKIQTALIPAAGFGTRFLPFTKAIPKEMLPLPDKPAIQHIVEECNEADIHDICMIISPEKQSIVHHFQKNESFSAFLHEKNKMHLISDLDRLIEKNRFHYVQQPQALGLGHAVRLAKDTVSGDFVAILLPDDIIIGPSPAIAQLAAIGDQYHASVLAIKEVAPEAISSYGVISIEKQLDYHTFKVNDVVEKPSVDKAPSHYAIVGRYILSSAIFDALDTITPGAGGELQLTDAIKKLLENNHPIVAHIVSGDRYDIGTPQGWLETLGMLTK